MLNIVNLPAIVDLKPKIALYDKKTNDILAILNYDELGAMKSVYKKFNKSIKDKETFWLNVAMYNTLSKFGYKEKLDDVGLRIDYNDTEIVIKNNVIRMIDVKFPIVLFEELVAYQKSNKNVLNKIKETLEGKGYKVFQTRSILSNIEIGNSTSDMILEFLTGHKIQGKFFTNTNVSQYNDINYFDNNGNRILYLKRINDLLQIKLESSDPNIAENIKEYINNENVNLTLNIISNNEVNPISKFVVKIKAYIKYIRNFENWKSNF